MRQETTPKQGDPQAVSRSSFPSPLSLTVILPTYNERENIPDPDRGHPGQCAHAGSGAGGR